MSILKYLCDGPSPSDIRSGATPPQDVRAWRLKAVIALGLVSGFLLAPRLWLSSRSFPLAPAFDGLPPLGEWLNVAWFVVLLILLGLLAVAPRAGRLIVLWISLAALLSLWDQSRWQPWFYQYGFMLAALAFYPWSNPQASAQQREPVLDACRLVVASMYVWGGLFKMNATFFRDVVPYLFEPLLAWLPASVHSFVLIAGVAIPLVELGIGLGLLTRKFRQSAVVLAAVMHGFILLSLGPLGRDYNSVIWPWNVAMVLFLLILFWHAGDVSFQRIVRPGRSACHWAALVLFGIMPGFHWLGLWDAYFSADLYSGGVATATMSISPEARDRLPGAVRPYMVKLNDGRYEVDLLEWSMGELNAPVNPEKRVFRKIAVRLCDYALKPSDIILVIQEPPDVFSGFSKETREDCSNP